MMNNKLHRWLSACRAVLIITILIFTSCTTELTLTLKQDDSVDICFEGGAGDAFTKMLLATSGATGMSAIDTEEITFELAKAGFDNVRVSAKDTSVKITMTDKKRSSYIFESGIVKYAGGKLAVNLSRKSLEDFYASSDEQIRMMLDLFLAPVFNDENMSESEYLEMLASFYGKSAAKEVETSLVSIRLIGKDGKEEKIRLPMTQLMCGIF